METNNSVIEQLDKELQRKGFTSVLIERTKFLELPWLNIIVYRGDKSIKLDMSVATLEKYGADDMSRLIFKEFNRIHTYR